MDLSLDFSDSSSWRRPGQRLRKAIIAQDGSKAAMQLSNECPLQQYIRVCDVVIRNFMEHSIDSKEDLLQAYVLGFRLHSFLSGGIPSHVDYDFFVAQNCNAKLLAVQNYLDELALLIDEREHANYIGEVISSSREDESFGSIPKAAPSSPDASMSLMLVSAGSGETSAEYGPRIHDSFSTENSIISKIAKPKSSDAVPEMETIAERHAGSFDLMNPQSSEQREIHKKTRIDNSPPRPKLETGVAIQQPLTDSDLLSELARLSLASNGARGAENPGRSTKQLGPAGTIDPERSIYISSRTKKGPKVQSTKLPWSPSLQPSLDSAHYVSSSSSSCESSPPFLEHKMCKPRISKPRIPPESHGPNRSRSVSVKSASFALRKRFTEEADPEEMLISSSDKSLEGSEHTFPLSAIVQTAELESAKTSCCVAGDTGGASQSSSRTTRLHTTDDCVDTSSNKTCLKRTGGATFAPAWKSPRDPCFEESKRKVQSQSSPVDVNGFPIVEELPAIPPLSAASASPSQDVSRKLTYSTAASPQRINFRSHSMEMVSLGCIRGVGQNDSSSQDSKTHVLMAHDDGIELADEGVLHSNPSWLSWSNVDFDQPSQRSPTDGDGARSLGQLRLNADRTDTRGVCTGKHEDKSHVSFRTSRTDEGFILNASHPESLSSLEGLDRCIKNHFKSPADTVQLVESVEAVNDGSGAELFFDRPGKSLVEDRHQTTGYGRPEENTLGFPNKPENIDHGQQGESMATCLPSVRFASCTKSHRTPIKAYTTGNDHASYKLVGPGDQQQPAVRDCNVEMLFNPHREQVHRRCRLDPLMCPNRSGGAAEAVRHEGPVDLDDSNLVDSDEFGHPPKRGCTRFFLG